MDIDDTDFAALYRAQMRRVDATPKTASAWDSRATSYRQNSGQSNYVNEFMAHLNFGGARTLLDVGCGPGTLALPLATRFEQVVAIDYSTGMLQALRERALADNIGNISTLHCAWEDDWRNVPVCDIAIASRSTNLADLGAALVKLNAHARLRVYLTYLVGVHFVDSEILALVGSAAPATPDLSLVLGILCQMGITPRLDYIDTPSRLAGCVDFDEFAERVAWSTGPFDEDARLRLKGWYEADALRASAGGAAMRWALVSWEKFNATTKTTRS